MRMLTSEEIAACRKLAESIAEEHVDSHIEWVNKKTRISSDQAIALIFDDYCWYADFATDTLVANGYMDRPSGYSHGHEKLLAFKAFEESYGRKMSALIKDRYKTYLLVPFYEKDSAKSLGARWDGDVKKWYVPEGISSEPFAKWIEPSPPPLSETAKLIIEMVPSTAWFSNLRSEVTPDEWTLVKRATFKPAKYICEICSGRGPEHPVECHERWQYNMEEKVQKLIGTISLCPACHESTHYGLASVRGREEQARLHLMQVNCWTGAQANKYIREVINEWKARSTVQWTLDARWLIDFVPLSDGTKNKILDHAAGRIHRKIEDWQQEVAAEQVYKARI